ncbi:MAG: hypothetical protein H6745_22425 [Deltaproteobacteria bacterium]|nr:hypothetical protein [Deltaproteobacteria bacterium]
MTHCNTTMAAATKRALATLGLGLGLLLGGGSATAAQEAVDLDAGQYHTCMVTSCGDVRCFGRNDWHQSDDHLRSRGVVLASAFQAAFEEVTVGTVHTCARDVTGKVRCWGQGTRGQLGVPAGVTFTQIDAGDTATCGLDAAGHPHCWGSGGVMFGVPTTERFLSLSVGRGHACGIVEGAEEIRCWGDNGYGQARIGEGVGLFYPGTSERFSEVTAGNYHSCAVSNGGRAYCWGWDGYGAVTFGGRFQDLDGDGVFTYLPQFQSQVSAGLWGTCEHYHPNTSGSSTWGDRTYCWGWPFERAGFPAPATDLTQQIAVGSSFACAIDDAGQVVCWGSGYQGSATPPTLAAECPFTPYVLDPPRFGFGG